MNLFHGSYVEIPDPDLSHSRDKLDFGKGFYTTSLYEQAAQWCRRFKRSGRSSVISKYSFDEKAFEELSILRFETYSEEWLDYILNCRSGHAASQHDIVIGGVANDKVFNTVELYFDGLIDKTEAIRRLRFEKPNLQICFCTDRALQYLNYTGSEEI